MTGIRNHYKAWNKRSCTVYGLCHPADVPFLRQPIETQLKALTAELGVQWLAFNRELKQGKLTQLEYDKDTQTLRDLAIGWATLTCST